MVDTSIWINFLKGNKNFSTNELIAFIEDYTIYINGIIFNEICFGAKDEKQFGKYSTIFSEISLLDSNPLMWKELNKQRFFLKRKGITTSITDSIIAFDALSNDLPLYTLDQDFLIWKKHFNLKCLGLDEAKFR